jgi:hypothetical protein
VRRKDVPIRDYSKFPSQNQWFFRFFPNIRSAAAKHDGYLPLMMRKAHGTIAFLRVLL